MAPRKTSLPLICQWNGDGDIARAWLAYYTKLGVNEFHIILHGPEEENIDFLAAAANFPVKIRDRYESPYIEEERLLRVNKLLPEFVGQWIFVVDSDEFVELPLGDVWTLIAGLELFQQTSLFAPFVQRLRADGSLTTPPTIEIPYIEFPLCDPLLSSRVGYSSERRKYPLIRVLPETRIWGGNHTPPNYPIEQADFFIGATHHFKWKRSLLNRLGFAVESQVEWIGLCRNTLDYLRKSNGLLPVDKAFKYSRKNMFNRGLLVRPSFRRTLIRLARQVLQDPHSLGLIIAHTWLLLFKAAQYRRVIRP